MMRDEKAKQELPASYTHWGNQSSMNHKALEFGKNLLIKTNNCKISQKKNM